MNKKIKIGENNISNESKTYFIADIAANWDGNIKRAKKLIQLAAEAGADAAKFQNFKAETIISEIGFKKLSGGKKLTHQKSWKNSVYDVYTKASLPIEWTEELMNECEMYGIDYFTTPYDLAQIEYLSKYVKAWKIGSGDITWHELIKKLCKYKKTIFLATGASNFAEVKDAVKIVEKNKKNYVLMQCNTNYTASIENFKYINLNVLKTFKKYFPNAILGLSDHTPGHTTVLGAVTLGAKVIEKHFTDNNNRVGPDHKFSMNPKSWKEMVIRTRELELSLGSYEKKIEKNELESVLVQRRSIRLKHDIKKGKRLNYNDFVMLRPISRSGFSPSNINNFIRKYAKRNLLKGDEIKLSDVVKSFK